MSDKTAENDLTMWLSTYGLITAERILEKYKIRLQSSDLLTALKNPQGFYHRIMRIPLKNVLNGIILQQAHDYQVYVQKLLIDYLISGEGGRGEDSPGGDTRDDLEAERTRFVEMGETFHQQEVAHQQLIAQSQKALIKETGLWQKRLATTAKTIKEKLRHQDGNPSEDLILQSVNSLLVDYDLSQGNPLKHTGGQWARVETHLKQSLDLEARQVFVEQIAMLANYTADLDILLNGFMEKINEMNQGLKQYRSDFYSTILRVTDLIKLLPEYRHDMKQIEENREALRFDSEIGEDS